MLGCSSREGAGDGGVQAWSVGCVPVDVLTGDLCNKEWDDR